MSYTPALSSGTQVIVYVVDSNGQEAWSDPVHIPLRFVIFLELPNDFPQITLGAGDSSCLGTPTPNQDTSYTPPADDPSTYNPPSYNPPNTYTPSTDNQNTDNQGTDNSTTDNGADSSYQSPPDDSSSSSSSSSVAATDTTL